MFLSTGALYTHHLNTTFAVNTGDRTGWTNEGNYGAISFQYVERHRTFFVKGNLTGQGLPTYPTVGHIVTFDATYLPSMFSVAVELDPTLPGATGATGLAGGAGGIGMMGAQGSTGPPGGTGFTDSPEGVPPGPAGPSGPGIFKTFNFRFLDLDCILACDFYFICVFMFLCYVCAFMIFYAHRNFPILFFPILHSLHFLSNLFLSTYLLLALTHSHLSSFSPLFHLLPFLLTVSSLFNPSLSTLPSHTNLTILPSPY